MIIGDPERFAIESLISIAYKEPGAMALGFFVIHIGGVCYGVRKPDATLLACSLDVVERRISRRGSHITSAVRPGTDAGLIANAFRFAVYAPDAQRESFFGSLGSDLADELSSWNRDLVWAPDGDEAFDDGSFILHFDVGDMVRLVGFKSNKGGYEFEPTTLREVWLTASEFYDTARLWRDNFRQAWEAAPKNFAAGDSSPEHLAEIDRVTKLPEV